MNDHEREWRERMRRERAEVEAWTKVWRVVLAVAGAMLAVAVFVWW